MRGKTRANDGGPSKSPEPIASQLPTIVVAGSGSVDGGKPDTGTVTSEPNSDVGGIAPPEFVDFGTIEPEEPTLTPITSYAGGLDPGPRTRRDGKPDGRSLRSGRTKEAASSKNLNATNLLLGIHEILAQFTGIPEFRLAETEAKEYGDAAIELCNELNIPITRKQVAIGNFVGAVTKIYATRWTAYRIRRHMESEMRPDHVEVIRETARRQTAPPPQPPQAPVSMPTPANMGQSRNDENGIVKMAPSQLWAEGAADFPNNG